jgi:hypothetical protein
MTQDVYLARKLSDNRAAAALEAALGKHPDETHG